MVSLQGARVASETLVCLGTKVHLQSKPASVILAMLPLIIKCNMPLVHIGSD